MLIENEFTVKRPIDEVWSYLLDVEKIAPCMPGAELTETVDDHTWNGKVNMAFGPVKMAFAGSVSMEERDDAAHRVALKAKGTEQKGKGAANATVTSWLEPIDGGTKVSMQADITLTGAAAQMSRGLLPEVSKRLTQQFADCLEESLAANASPAAASAAGARGGVRRCGGGVRNDRGSEGRAGRREAGRRHPPRPRRDLVDDRRVLPEALRRRRRKKPS